jgi:chlorophyllide a hydrolase
MAIDTEIWIYWGFCAIATILVVVNHQFVYEVLLSPEVDESRHNSGYKLALGLGWGMTLVASVIYVLFTTKYETGGYQLPDLIAFAIFNGILEQFMFVLWFLAGCYLGCKLFPKHPLRIFVSGYLSYAIYSGLIHVFFWVPVLPSHEPFAPMIAILPFMSVFWMWLLWKYRAVVSIMAMHIAIDFITIGHLHFHWFESIQLV